MPTKPMDQKDRIRRAVEFNTTTGCWEWQKSKDRLGYGRLKVSLGSRSAFRYTSAHRYAHELWIGPIPDGLSVLHKCDNRSCCRPDHLFLGTQQENIADMHMKGRGPRGYKRDPVTCRQNAMKKRSHKNQHSIDAARQGEGGAE